MNPMAPNSMMAISNSLTLRINHDFSYLSANTPAEAENRKNGRMNKPAARLMNKLLEIGSALEPANATNNSKTFLKILSLKAPKLSNEIGQELSLRK